jgi:hypothetical protein
MQKSFAAALAQERLRESKVAAAIGDNVALNRAVEILFILSTCKEGCRGGAHVLENLLGRILNHVTVGIMADAAGFHDEALSLLRSTGEITNLLALFRLDAKAYGQWVGASEGDRRRTFSPVKVRLAVDKHRTIAVPMDQEMYERLCERYAHCTPSTSPNSYRPSKLLSKAHQIFEPTAAILSTLSAPRLRLPVHVITCGVSWSASTGCGGAPPRCAAFCPVTGASKHAVTADAEPLPEQAGALQLTTGWCRPPTRGSVR